MQRIQESEQRPLLAFCGRTQKHPDLPFSATSTLTWNKVNQGKRRVRPPHLVGRSITSGEISLVGNESSANTSAFSVLGTWKAHPKPTSWRHAGSPRCLRWACLHPSERSTRSRPRDLSGLHEPIGEAIGLALDRRIERLDRVLIVLVCEHG